MFQSKFEHVVEENKKLRKIIAELKIANKKLRLDNDKKLLIVFITIIGSAIIGDIAYSFIYLFNDYLYFEFYYENTDLFDKFQLYLRIFSIQLLCFALYKLVIIYRR